MDGCTADEDAGNRTIAEDPFHCRHTGALSQQLIYDHQTGPASGGIGYRLFLGCGDSADSIAHFLQHLRQKHADHRVVFYNQDIQGCHFANRFRVIPAGKILLLG
jgi:hypothetical protein